MAPGGDSAMIYLLPGMGADRRMYGPKWKGLPNATFPNWPPFSGQTTLGEVADQLIAEHDIAPRDVIGGSSLGGMVALEIFQRLKNPKVVLLGSALSPGEINTLLRLLAPLASITPFGLLQVLVGKHPSDAAVMFAEADPKFVRAMCLALRDWQGFDGPHDRLVRIHGAKDHVITCPAEGHILPRAGHLVAMTHAAQCIRVLSACLRGGSCA